MRPHEALMRLASMIRCYQMLCYSNAMLIRWTSSHPLTKIKLLLTLNSKAAKCCICCVLCSELNHKRLQNEFLTFHLSIGPT